MPKNRLKLDFSLQTNEERAEFVQNYIESLNQPTEDELEMMGNYILWGKDPQTGKNSVQSGDVEIESRNSTWSRPNTESLDALIESPTFNEATLIPKVPTKKTHEVFDRAQCLQECPEYLRATFRSLFDEIDELDLLISYYELRVGKRKNPPREKLLNRFTTEEQTAIELRANSLNQFKYLKMRHLLVELRREQFTMRDSYKSSILPHYNTPVEVTPDTFDFSEDCVVLPLGLFSADTQYIFQSRKTFDPHSFREDQLEEISEYYWKMQQAPDSRKLVIDFRQLEDVYALFLEFFEIREDGAGNDELKNTNAILDTLLYYIDLAELKDFHKEILDMKILKVRNQDIAAAINKKYNKSYTPNYISTIFRHKIIPQINAAAVAHNEIISQVFFPENFKKCTCCGKWLLKSTDNFMRKSRANDGFASRCKRCDSLTRQKNKTKEELVV